MSGELDLTNLPPGALIGGYRLDGRLGRGGMGTVYLAEQVSIGRQVAVKILHADRVGQADRVEAFLKEARLAASLSHHGLVTIHDVGQLPQMGIVYYAMDYIHGRTLHMKIAQEGPMLPEAARHLMIAVAEAIGHAHRQGLVHRDLKPENILIDEHGHPKITDLGLATDKINQGAANNARTIRIVGTPGWSAPEQLRNPDWARASSDVFSIGCILYYTLTGRPPFTGETLLDLAVNVATETPALFDQLLPEDQRILDALLGKLPGDRPPDGSAAAAMIYSAMHDPVVSKTTSRVRRRPRRRR